MIADDDQDMQVLVVSDFTGETAHTVALAAARQFPEKKFKFTRHRYVRDIESAKQLCREAKERNGVMVCTLVNRGIREIIKKEALSMGVEIVDVIGPLMEAFSLRLQVEPEEEPDLAHQMDETYFKRVKAIEYSITCDDGSNPHLLDEADLVILGVSRTCKTPLSMYLANKGYKVGNIPLVPELDPPDQLFEIQRDKIIGLIISPEALIKIRKERLQVLGLDPEKASYAQMERVEKELSNAKAVMKRLGAKVFDVTGRAIEETAQEILDLIGEERR